VTAGSNCESVVTTSFRAEIGGDSGFDPRRVWIWRNKVRRRNSSLKERRRVNTCDVGIKRNNKVRRETCVVYESF